MAKDKNHTGHNQLHKNHRNGINSQLIPLSRTYIRTLGIQKPLRAQYITSLSGFNIYGMIV